MDQRKPAPGKLPCGHRSLIGATDEMRPARRAGLRASLALTAPLALAGCGGGDGGLDLTVLDGLPFTDSAVLLAYFVENFDPFQTLAQQLIDQSPRYLLQQASGSQYVDLNGNGRFDGSDVSLLSNPIRHSGIQYAHAAGLTGAGQTIAISDEGFLTGHETLAGKTLTLGSGLTVEDHGTFVASVAAGDSSTMIGVAPGADLILGSFDSFSSLAQTANTAASMDAVALNNSWGFPGQSASTSGYNAIFGSSSGQSYLNALRNYANTGIVVFAAPNEYNADIGIMAGLPRLEPSLESSWLAVINAVPVMQNEDIVSAQRVSAACGNAAAWCLAADGSWTGATSASTGSYQFGTGSSYATPTVSGSLALLAEAFPTLSPQELRIRLLASADNEFTGFTASSTVELVPGFERDVSSIWGHGFLDVKAALLPIGQPVVTLANGVTHDANQPLVVSSTATGDAISRSLENVTVIATDALSAEFEISGESLVATTAAAPLFSSFDLRQAGHPDQNPNAALTFYGQNALPGIQFGDFEFSFHVPVNSSEPHSFGFTVSRAYELVAATVEFSLGMGGDSGELLPDWSEGSFSSVFSAGLDVSTPVTHSTSFGLSAGIAAARGHSDLTSSGDMILNTAGVSMTTRNVLSRDDSLKLSLSLPVAVASGSTQLSLPIATASGGAVAYQNVNIDLAPNQRERQISLNYETALSDRTSFSLSLLHAENRGNIAGQRESGILLGLKSVF